MAVCRFADRVSAMAGPPLEIVSGNSENRVSPQGREHRPEEPESTTRAMGPESPNPSDRQPLSSPSAGADCRRRCRHLTPGSPAPRATGLPEWASRAVDTEVPAILTRDQADRLWCR